MQLDVMMWLFNKPKMEIMVTFFFFKALLC